MQTLSEVSGAPLPVEEEGVMAPLKRYPFQSTNCASRLCAVSLLLWMQGLDGGWRLAKFSFLALLGPLCEPTRSWYVQIPLREGSLGSIRTTIEKKEKKKKDESNICVSVGVQAARMG